MQRAVGKDQHQLEGSAPYLEWSTCLADGVAKHAEELQAGLLQCMDDQKLLHSSRAMFLHDSLPDLSTRGRSSHFKSNDIAQAHGLRRQPSTQPFDDVM